MATPRKSRAKAIPVPATFVAVAPSRPRARSKKVVPTDVVAVSEMLEFYMGKNTPDRQDFIIENLHVEKDEI